MGCSVSELLVHRIRCTHYFIILFTTRYFSSAYFSPQSNFNCRLVQNTMLASTNEEYIWHKDDEELPFATKLHNTTANPSIRYDEFFVVNFDDKI
jgi:hypothetical protein